MGAEAVILGAAGTALSYLGYEQQRRGNNDARAAAQEQQAAQQRALDQQRAAEERARTQEALIEERSAEETAYLLDDYNSGSLLSLAGSDSVDVAAERRRRALRGTSGTSLLGGGTL